MVNAKQYLMFLDGLSRDHPSLQCLTMWVQCLHNTSQLETARHVRCMSLQWTALVQLDLFLGGLDSYTVVSMMGNLHLPSLRDFRLCLAYNYTYDTQNPVHPELPCPGGFQSLKHLHLQLGYRIPPSGLQPWIHAGLSSLTNLSIGFTDAPDNRMVREIARLVKGSGQTIRELAMHNIAVNPPRCDSAALRNLSALLCSTHLEKWVMMQPMDLRDVNLFFHRLPPTVRTLDLRLADITQSHAVVLRPPSFIVRLCIWVPSVSQHTLPRLGWLACPSSRWKFDSVQRTHQLDEGHWMIREG